MTRFIYFDWSRDHRLTLSRGTELDRRGVDKNSNDSGRISDSLLWVPAE
jgi:hypothetical protein